MSLYNAENDTAWALIADGAQEATTQLIMAACITHTRMGSAGDD